MSAAEDHQSLLWDSKTFSLEDHWPRSSVLSHSKLPYTRQPVRTLYETFFYVTFPLRILFVILPKTYYEQYHSEAASRRPNMSFFNAFCVFVGRSLIGDLWIPTGGGARGHHFDKALTDKERTALRKKTKALPYILSSSSSVSPCSTFSIERQLRQPIRAWAKEAGVVEAKHLTAWWFGRRSEHLQQPKAVDGEKLTIYLSGGGYHVGTCYPTEDLGSIGPLLMKQYHANAKSAPKTANRLPTSLLSLEYRRTGLAPTPAALIDALTLYYHLIHDLAFVPANISLIGDSAGGHLVNALVRYLVEGGEATPGKIVLISPWGDQAGTIVEHPTSSFQRYHHSDVLSDHFYHYCKDFYASRFPGDPHDTLLDVYNSPAAILGKVRTRDVSSAPPSAEDDDDDKKQKSILVTAETEKDIFKGWPATLLLYGRYETLKDQSEEMYKRLDLAKKAEGKGAAASPAQLSSFMMDTCHDPFIMPPFAFTRERKDALKRIADWIALDAEKSSQ